MSDCIKGLRILGPGLLSVLCLMSFAAASAHAANDWLVMNPTTHENELVLQNLVLSTVNDTQWIFTTKSGANAIQITCENAELTKGLLEAEGKTSGVLALSKCTTKVNGKLETGCAPAQPFEMSLKTTPFIHGGVMYELVEPATSGVFGTMKFNEETCVAIAPAVKITGTLVEDFCDNIEVYAKRHLSEAVMNALFASGEHISSLSFGANPLTLTGSIWKRLVVNGVEREWKFMP
jgi:hypothetical protein